jgi:uncharacterized OsmC-like protein
MSAESIRASVQGAIEFLTEHPDQARYRDSAAVARAIDGLRVRVEGPNGESLETDMPESVGGTNAAPSPGWLFRASLASCVAMMIQLRAAHQGVEADGITVIVDSESDDRGILGIDENVPAGPFSVAVKVTGAGEGLREVVRWAFDHCPVTDAAARALDISLEID